MPLVNDIVNNALFFHSSPNTDQILLQITHVLRFCPLDSLLTYVAEFVVNRIEVMAVRHGKCSAVGFTWFLRMASLQTLQTMITLYDTHTE